MNEAWAPVPGFPNYEVSDKGRVRSRARSSSWRTLKACANGRGYLLVQLFRDGKFRSAHVHRLVAEVFLGRQGPHLQVAHLDGNKVNNCLANLAWVSPAKNSAHKVAHGTAQRGEQSGRAKLTDEAVRWIRSRRGELSQTAMASALGLSISAVNQAQLGRTWKHVT